MIVLINPSGPCFKLVLGTVQTAIDAAKNFLNREQDRLDGQTGGQKFRPLTFFGRPTQRSKFLAADLAAKVAAFGPARLGRRPILFRIVNIFRVLNDIVNYSTATKNCFYVKLREITIAKNKNESLSVAKKKNESLRSDNLDIFFNDLETIKNYFNLFALTTSTAIK
ncbi:hypothetical protein BpHYR1_010309 [Brachionus plicatilis]|uniref:Uncharacterized protein n=1 Tax=Brachionus plicatilis TaxID=10195 RepID=A0A3M7T8C2_BRAPC|nr:hypothetical protein BpHYR1_010309 [Brachionus plicatilis]